MSLITTKGNRNIENLQKASEKYEDETPDARIATIYNNGHFKYYYELKDCEITEYTFSVERKQFNLSADENEEDIRKDVMQILTSNIDNMYCGKILKTYLEDAGIEYEDEQEDGFFNRSSHSELIAVKNIPAIFLFYCKNQIHLWFIKI